MYRAHLIFYGYDRPLGAQDFLQYSRTQHNLIRLFAHQHLIATDVGFALSAVEYQSMNSGILAGFGFCMSGVHRTAEAGNTGTTNGFIQCFGTFLFPISAG